MCSSSLLFLINSVARKGSFLYPPHSATHPIVRPDGPIAIKPNFVKKFRKKRGQYALKIIHAYLGSEIARPRRVKIQVFLMKNEETLRFFSIFSQK